MTISVSEIQLIEEKVSVDPNVLNGFAFLKPGDCHVIAGTLAEGIGNIASDLDCYAFVRERPKYGELTHINTICQTESMERCQNPSDEVFLTFDYYPETYLHSEIEYWTFDSIEAVLRTLSEEYADSFTHTRFLSETTIKGSVHDILHRLQFAIPTFGAGVFDDLINKLDLNKKLSYVLFRSTSNFYWHFKDLSGALDANDPDLCFTTASDYFQRQLTGYLYLLGFTNPRKRWVHTYLRQMHNDKPELTDRIRGILFTGVSSDQDKFKYLNDVLEVCDEILDAANPVLNTLHPNEESIKQLEQEMSERDVKDSIMFEEELEYRRRVFDRGRGKLKDLIDQLK